MLLQNFLHREQHNTVAVKILSLVASAPADLPGRGNENLQWRGWAGRMRIGLLSAAAGDKPAP